MTQERNLLLYDQPKLLYFAYEFLQGCISADSHQISHTIPLTARRMSATVLKKGVHCGGHGEALSKLPFRKHLLLSCWESIQQTVIMEKLLQV